MSISILILTKNEEQDLPGCLESVKWSDDIHVYDSMSTDKTEEIALHYGAKVYCTQRGCMQNVCDSLAGISFGADYKIEDLVERIITDSKREEFSLAAKQGRVKQYNDLVLKNKNDFEHLLKEMLA